MTRAELFERSRVLRSFRRWRRAPAASVDSRGILELSAFPQEEGIHHISAPRNFATNEQEYDEFIGGAWDGNWVRCGRGAWQIANHHAGRPIESLLEIGSGGGTCSLGLVASAPHVHSFITDTSPTFLKMVRAKLNASGLPSDRVAFATLAGEDLHLLPPRSVDAIVVASALHHVSDWRAFLREAARILRPGGVLVIQEPFREGQLMMGMALDVVFSELWPKDVLGPGDLAKIAGCRDTIYYMADSTIVKEGEDKHLFVVSDLVAAGAAVGLQTSAFYSNRHFVDLTDCDLSSAGSVCSFAGYLASFLQLHHRVSPEGMLAIRQYLLPLLGRIEARFLAGDGPPLLGSMVFRR